MNGISPEVTTLCLIAIGVGIMIIFGGFLVLRIIKGSFFGLGMMAMRMLSEPKEEKEAAHSFSPERVSANDLRSKAQSLDFDAAVAKYRKDEPEDQAAAPNPPPSPYQGYPPPNPTPRQDNDPFRRQ
jgi:hypothetical protein